MREDAGAQTSTGAGKFMEYIYIYIYIWNLFTGDSLYFARFVKKTLAQNRILCYLTCTSSCLILLC